MSLYRKSQIFEAFQLPSKDAWDLRPFFDWTHEHNITKFTIKPDCVEFAPEYQNKQPASPEEWIVQHDDGVWLYSPQRFNQIYERVEETTEPTKLGDLDTAQAKTVLAGNSRET